MIALRDFSLNYNKFTLKSRLLPAFINHLIALIIKGIAIKMGNVQHGG